VAPANLASSATSPAHATAEAAQRILHTAERLFAEHGYEGVSINMIAEQAGVSKGNIFHHFSSKETLYQTVLGSACAEARRLLDELVNRDGDLAERLLHFAAAHIAHLERHYHLTRLVQRELLEGGVRRGKELAEQLCGENFARLVEILRNAQGRGELRKELDPALIAQLLVGSNIFFFQARNMLRHFPDVDFADDPLRYSRMVVKVILAGIVPPSSTQGA
jgi:TetR/AcrR family transcriptional regulator